MGTGGWKRARRKPPVRSPPRALVGGLAARVEEEVGVDGVGAAKVVVVVEERLEVGDLRVAHSEHQLEHRREVARAVRRCVKVAPAQLVRALDAPVAVVVEDRDLDTSVVVSFTFTFV